MVRQSKSSVPALSRGLEVFRLLATPMTLEEIQLRTRIPKSSLQRILAILQKENLLIQDEETRIYRAALRMVPHEGYLEDHLERQLESAMVRLAEETGHTVEWFLPTKSGQVLARRQIPQNSLVHVRSWLGQVYPWSGCFSAIACVARAWWSNHPQPGEEFWIYGPSQKKLPISHAKARRMMDDSLKCGLAEDRHFDEEGIRRIAGVVWGNKKPIGTLALAQCNVPRLLARAKHNRGKLLEEILHITDIAKKVMPMVEKGGNAL